MNEEPRNEETQGAAIDPSELEALAAEYDQPEGEDGAGELMEPEGPGTAELLQPLIDFGCQIGCPNWAVQKAEREALAGAYGDLIDKYYPEGVGQFGVELNALLMTAAIFGPRLASGRPARKVERQAEPETDTEGGDDAG